MKNTRNGAIFAISAIVLSFTGIAYASDDDHKNRYPKSESSESPKPSPSPSESETPKPKPTKSPTPSPSPSESESPKPEPTKSPEPTPTPTVTPTPTPTPTPTVTPTPTPTPTPTVTPKPTPTPKPTTEIGGSDPKPTEPPIKEVEEKYTKTVQCGKPVTFNLTGPNDATYTVLEKPKKGSLTINLKNNTVTWTPNKNHCQIGGNDKFVIQWVDSKGNRGTITKIVVTLRQGDVPNLIRTGR